MSNPTIKVTWPAQLASLSIFAVLSVLFLNTIRVFQEQRLLNHPLGFLLLIFFTFVVLVVARSSLVRHIYARRLTVNEDSLRVQTLVRTHDVPFSEIASIMASSQSFAVKFRNRRYIISDFSEASEEFIQELSRRSGVAIRRPNSR